MKPKEFIVYFWLIVTFILLIRGHFTGIPMWDLWQSEDNAIITLPYTLLTFLALYILFVGPMRK